MKTLTFLVIAGDPSGDMAAADLVRALRNAVGAFPPRFFGAGGPAMREAGVQLDFELTGHSVIGLEILRRLRFFQQAFQGLLRRAQQETPDAVIGVDYSGFNLRFAGAIKAGLREGRRPFHNWRPRLIQYIAPQVWASRAGRARRMEQTHDLLLSILPFEPAWFSQHAPRLKVQFVGHPLVDRRQGCRPATDWTSPVPPEVVLLPGSRDDELKRHLPVLIPAAERIRRETGARLRLILPAERLRPLAETLVKSHDSIDLQVGGLDEALQNATIALASTGTVTLECAWFGVPTVALYKTSWLTYQIGRRIVTIRHLAMPNLLAGETVLPELVQDAATPDAIVTAALELLRNEPRRRDIRLRLLALARQLGEPGTSNRAARAILDLLPPSSYAA